MGRHYAQGLMSSMSDTLALASQSSQRSARHIGNFSSEQHAKRYRQSLNQQKNMSVIKGDTNLTCLTCMESLSMLMLLISTY